MDQSKTAGDPGQKRTDDSWQDHGVTDGKRLWNCIISRGKTKEIFNSDNKSMFDELLDSISNAFEYWRYIYEKDDGFIYRGNVLRWNGKTDYYLHMTFSGSQKMDPEGKKQSRQQKRS